MRGMDLVAAITSPTFKCHQKSRTGMGKRKFFQRSTNTGSPSQRCSLVNSKAPREGMVVPVGAVESSLKAIKKRNHNARSCEFGKDSAARVFDSRLDSSM